MHASKKNLSYLAPRFVYQKILVPAGTHNPWWCEIWRLDFCSSWSLVYKLVFVYKLVLICTSWSSIKWPDTDQSYVQKKIVEKFYMASDNVWSPLNKRWVHVLITWKWSFLEKCDLRYDPLLFLYFIQEKKNGSPRHLQLNHMIIFLFQ